MSELIIQTISPEIIDLAYYSTGFPQKQWNDLVKRDNYLSHIKSELANDYKIVFLEGDDDSGKTILCAQFCKENPNNSISVFFNPLNKNDFRIDFFYSNIVAQIRHMLGDDLDSIEGEGYMGVKEYRKYLLQLKKKLKRSNEIVYLILDGLDDTSRIEDEFLTDLIDVLPFGEEFFRIIISGKQSDFQKISTSFKRINSKPVSLTGFTRHEVTTFLNIGEDKLIGIEDLYTITKGYPGRLETLKRLILKHSYDIENISKTLTYKGWIQLDCESINLEDSFNSSVLSILALSDDVFNLNDIAKINAITVNEAINKINEIYVLEKNGEKINFISNSHKKYYSTLLQGSRKKVDEILTEYYASENSLNSKFRLSKIYAEQGKWKEIIPIVNEDFLFETLKSTGSLEVVRECIKLGFTASEQMNKYAEKCKYSVQGSIINELDDYLFLESEILARIALKDFAGAIALSDKTVLKVDRLRLLTLIARKEKQINNKVDEELVSLIQELYSNTDLSLVGNVIYDIVSDLIYAIPNLAIEIIENSSGSTSEKNINDWIVAKLSVAAINSSAGEQDEIEKNKKLDALQNLNNPSVRNINRAITFMVGNYSAKKVLNEVSKLSDSTERLKLLRLWLNNNTKHKKNIETAIEKALDELVSSSSESILTLESLKDLSHQLAFVNDFKAKQQLLTRFKSIEGNLKDLGLSRDKYIYKLNLFHAEYTLNKEKSIPTLNKIISEVENIEDLLVRIESFSEIYAKLNMMSKAKFADKNRFLYSRISSLSEEIFKKTANHYKISQSFIKTISKVNPVFSLKICTHINTELSRDRIRLLILDSYLNNNIRHIKIEFLEIIEESIENDIPKIIALKNILERYSESKNLHFNVIKSLFVFIKRIKNLHDMPSNMTYYYVLVYKIIAKNDRWKQDLSRTLRSNIKKHWDKIEADWEKVDVGFIICSEIAEIDKEFAEEVFNDNEKFRNNSWIDSQSIYDTYTNSVKLVIKAYSGLLVSKNDSDKDYKILVELINRIPSEIEKLVLWTEIGIESHLIERPVITKKLYDNHVLPLLQGIMHKKLHINKVLSSFILVHNFNSDLAIEYINTLSKNEKERACAIICEFYISQRNPFEVYEGEINKYDSTSNDILKAIPLLNLIDTDYILSELIEEICRALSNNKNVITKLQKTDLADRLALIIKIKLPDQNNIKHAGYEILSNARLEKFKKSATGWQIYVNQTTNIPNLSDRVFVKALLLKLIPNKKGSDIRSNLFYDVLEELDEMDIHYEFVDRVIHISDIMYEVNKTKWKEVVNKAFKISNSFDEGTEMYDSQKSIVDSMYRLDPEFAKELIALNDNENKEYIKKYYDSLEISKKIKNNQSLKEKEKVNIRMIIQGVVSAHGALNSGKISTKKISDSSKYLYLGNKRPLKEVLPVYMYYLSNSAYRFKDANDKDGAASKSLKAHFRALVNVTNLVQLISHRRKDKSNVREFFIDDDFSTNFIMKPNSREEAFGIINNWVQDEVEEFVVIADSYFNKEDIEVLKMFQELTTEIEINILGSKDGHKRDIEDEYKKQWKKMSDEYPPFTKITFCWAEDEINFKPIHDRWIITKNSGLRLGTSINGLGVRRESEISILKPNEATKILETTLKEYISQSKRSANNQRLSYKSFTL